MDVDTYIDRRFRDELALLGVLNETGGDRAFEHELQMALTGPHDPASQQFLRGLADRHGDALASGFAAWASKRPDQWWNAAARALLACGITTEPEDNWEQATPERRTAFDDHFLIEVQDGERCYNGQWFIASSHGWGVSPGGDPNYGPIVVDESGTSPVVGIFLGEEYVPVEPAHVLDALLLPLRRLSGDKELQERARQCLTAVFDHVVRELREGFRDTFRSQETNATT